MDIVTADNGLLTAGSSYLLESVSSEYREAFTKSRLSRDNFEFRASDSRWVLSKDIKVNVASTEVAFDERDRAFFRLALAEFAKKNSPSTADNACQRIRGFIRAAGEGLIFNESAIISYRSSLPKNDEWKLGTIRSFLKFWYKQRYPGVTRDLIKLLDSFSLSGNVKGRAVQSFDPNEGPFTTIEQQAISSSLEHALSERLITISDYLDVAFFLFTGRRPGQAAALKFKDFFKKGDRHYLNVPRAKQHGVPWRGSFNAIPVIEDLALSIQHHCDIVANTIDEILLRKGMPESDVRQLRDECPIFPNLNAFKIANLSDFENGAIDQIFHVESRYFTDKMHGLESVLDCISERTGKSINLASKRFRYTLGSNLAREGAGPYYIAEALDHSDTQNIDAYTRNVPEIVERIDKALALQLAPLAQAFNGVIVKLEKDAIRGNDPKSRIRSTDGSDNVGTCGSYGFCGAIAPIGCYTCNHFQPWRDGPHEQVLDELLKDRGRINELTGDLTIASQNDRLILAVSDVIRRCQIAKDEDKEKESING